MSHGVGDAPVAPAGIRRRVLVAWDYGASGVWEILSAEELAAPAPPGKWVHGDRRAVDREQARPWSCLLSVDLLDALKDWNDRGPTVFGGPGDLGDASKEDAFYREAEELAGRTQKELGAGYEVLFVVAGGAWRWVDPPYRRA